MWRLIKHAGKYIFLLLMLVCFGHILSTGTLLNDYGTPVIYYLNEMPYDLDTVISMKENDESLENYLPFTAAGSLDGQAFSNPDLGKTLNCQMVYIFGNSSLLCTASGELMADDLSGCILSSEAAWQLFGENRISSGQIIYQDKTYYVRGVYEDKIACIILPAQSVFAKKDSAASSAENSWDSDVPEQKAAFNKIIVKPDGDMASGSIRNEYIQSFENRWGLGSNKTDCLIYQRLASFFMMLIPALILIAVLIKGIQYIIHHRYQPFWLAAGCVGTVVLFFTFFVICQTSPSIPTDLIPNRWSDFDFWSDLFNTFKNSIQHILFLNKSEIELMYFKPLTSLIGYTLAGIVLFFAANHYFTMQNARDFFVTIIISCIVELIAIYLLRSADLVLNTQQMLLYLWPYLLIGKFIFKSDTENNYKNS